jgi:hypothetical protein
MLPEQAEAGDRIFVIKEDEKRATSVLRRDRSSIGGLGTHTCTTTRSLWSWTLVKAQSLSISSRHTCRGKLLDSLRASQACYFDTSIIRRGAEWSFSRRRHGILIRDSPEGFRD